MLAIQSGIANYHCLYTQGALAFQTPGAFLTHPVEPDGAERNEGIRSIKKFCSDSNFIYGIAATVRYNTVWLLFCKNVLL